MKRRRTERFVQVYNNPTRCINSHMTRFQQYFHPAVKLIMCNHETKLIPSVSSETKIPIIALNVFNWLLWWIYLVWNIRAVTGWTPASWTDGDTAGESDIWPLSLTALQCPGLKWKEIGGTLLFDRNTSWPLVGHLQSCLCVFFLHLTSSIFFIALGVQTKHNERLL